MDETLYVELIEDKFEVKNGQGSASFLFATTKDA